MFFVQKKNSNLATIYSYPPYSKILVITFVLYSSGCCVFGGTCLTLVILWDGMVWDVPGVSLYKYIYT
jgi:hypothetical protein